MWALGVLFEVLDEVADPCWLIEQLATESIAQFRETEEAQERVRRGERLEYHVASHKWESVALSREFWLTQCRSERPAWVLCAIQGDERKELLHFYQAMGLHRAHVWQQTLLARLRSHALARSLLQVIARHVVVWRSQLVAFDDLPEEESLKWEEVIASSVCSESIMRGDGFASETACRSELCS